MTAKAPDPPEIKKLKVEIGKRLEEIREARRMAQVDVAARIATIRETGENRGFVWRIEHGEANPEMTNLLQYITEGLQIEFREFCSYFTTDDGERRVQELQARDMLESLLREGPATRLAVISALREIIGPESVPDDKPSSRTTQPRTVARGSHSSE